MSSPSSEEDEPLSPEAQRAHDQVRKFMVISFATFGVGFVALLVAIFYKIFLEEPDLPAAAREPVTSLELNDGETILSATASEGRLYVLVGGDADRRILVIDEASGRLLRTISQ